MSEESMLTNSSTAKNQIEPPAADSSAIATSPDASNIVPFTSEASEKSSPLSEKAADFSEKAAECSAKASESVENAARFTENASERSTMASESAENTAGFTENASESPIVASESAEKATGSPARALESAEKAAGFTQKAAVFTGKAAAYTEKTFKKAASHIKGEDYDDELSDEDAPHKKRFHFGKDDKEFFRDKWILARISDENLMDYLTLEQKRNELQQQAKDIKEKRIFKAFIITVVLAAIVTIIYLLRDNPTILVNILYIAGITAALWFWKKSKDK